MFSFCPVCGAPLEQKHLPTEDRPRLVCLACGHVHYINPKVVAGTLPHQDGGVWLLRRGIEPRLGYWTYPAGYQEIDETTEQAAARETLEELGLAVKVTGLFGVYSRAGSHVVNVVYDAEPIPGAAQPRVALEAIEIGLFAPEQVPWDDLAFPSTHAVLSDWVRRAARDC